MGAFEEKVKFHKAAGPVSGMDSVGKMDGAWVYKVNFKAGHEFGDGRIDFNAEFEQSGDDPVLAWARSCPCGGTSLDACNTEDLPVKYIGEGSLDCNSNRNGRVLRCNVKCADGSNPKPNINSKCYREAGKKNRKVGEWSDARKTWT